MVNEVGPVTASGTLGMRADVASAPLAMAVCILMGP